MCLPLGWDSRVIVDDGVRAPACETGRSLVASALDKWVQKVSAQIKKKTTTSGLGLVRLLSQTLLERVQIISYCSDRGPESVVPASTVLRIWQLLFANGNQTILFLRLVLGFLCGNDIGSFFQHSHINVVILRFFGAVSVAVSRRGKLWWTWDEEDVEALHVVNRVGFLLLDFGTIEKVDVAALDGSYASVFSKRELCAVYSFIYLS